MNERKKERKGKENKKGYIRYDIQKRANKE